MLSPRHHNIRGVDKFNLKFNIVMRPTVFRRLNKAKADQKYVQIFECIQQVGRYPSPNSVLVIPAQKL